jgi:PKD repeat protein
MLSRNRIITWASFLLLLASLALTGAAHAAIEVTPESLVTPGQAVISGSEVAVFGINAVATAGETAATINSFEVDVLDDGLPPDMDPDVIEPADFASFSLYRDDGYMDGSYDSGDTLVLSAVPPFGPTVRADTGLAFTVVFSPISIPIPPDDTFPENAGYDYFVVMKTSTSISEGDDFLLRIPAQTISVLNPNLSFPPTNVDTAIITVMKSPTVKLTIKAIPIDGQGILPGSGAVELFAINGNADAPSFLSSVTLTVWDEGEEPEDGLQEITASDFLKFEIYRDGPGTDEKVNGLFNPPFGDEAPDIRIATIYSPFGYYADMHTPFTLTLVVPLEDPEILFNALLPAGDANEDKGDDFFVTVSTSDTIDSDFYMEEFSQIDDFYCVIYPFGVSVEAGGVYLYFPKPTEPEIETNKLVTEGISLDLQPIPMDVKDFESQYNWFPGSNNDLVNGAYRYYYFVPGENLRIRYLGERDREFTGISEDTIEAYEGTFEQPVVQTVERRHSLIGIDVAGGTSTQKEYLTGLTLTFSNLGSYLQTLIEFDPYFGIDRLIGSENNIWWLFFSGIAVYQDTNNNGAYDEPALDPDDYGFDPATGDQPLEFGVRRIPYGFGLPPYNENLPGTHYMLQLEFIDPPELEVSSDELPDFFIVSRLDSGDGDDSTLAGDSTAVNFGADFKISLERAEDYNFDGERETDDYNNDGLPQTPAVRFQMAAPHSSGLCILADNTPYYDIFHPYPSYPYDFREVRKSTAVVEGEDLAMDYGCDLPNDPAGCACTYRIVQRVDASSPPTALIGINATSSTVPQLHTMDDNRRKEITDIKLNFSGDGFEPSDIKDVLLVRDDKSPYDNRGGRSVGVFDIFNDLWNMPPPGASFGAAINSAEESPIPVPPWTWQDNEGVFSIVLYPSIAPLIYPNDDIESDASIDVFTDNFEMVQSTKSPSTLIPRDKVFSGADYFIVIETSDSISYDDEIRVEIPRYGLATSNGLSVFEGVNLFNPEDRYSNVQSVRANVPVQLHDLVLPNSYLGPNSDCATAVEDGGQWYVPVIGLNMYTNRPPASQGGVDVYFEQLIIAFLQYGTRDTLNIASDLLPFENVNGNQTANSGIQLYRDANGNGEFDGPSIDTLVKMDVTPSLGVNPSRVGLIGEEGNQVLMVFSSEENRQLVPSTDTGSNAGDDFFIVIRTSPIFKPIEDNFSVAIISFGPDSPFAPAPHTIDARENRPYDAISYLQAHPWGRRGIGFVDSNGFRTRSTETINTNVFNATGVTLLVPVTDFTSTLDTPQLTDPTHQVLLTWTDTNKDISSSPYVNENESGYWIESDIYGDFEPLANNPLPADTTSFFFDGPSSLAGKTIHFRIRPFRNNVPGTPLYPPFNGPGPTATCSATFWSSPRPEPYAYFSASPLSGCAPLTVNFTDGSYGDVTSYTWSFGDTDTSHDRNPSHIYKTANTYTVTLTATNSSGSGTYQKTITVNGTPTAIITGQSNACLGEPVTFYANTTGSPTQYSWNFGDGGTSALANPSHTYNTAGTFTVSLNVSSSCGPSLTTATKTITVSTGLVADFTYAPQDAVAPATITFTSASSCNATSWEWNFGDDSPVSNVQNPTHLYSLPGPYHVCLTVRNGISSQTGCNDVVISSSTPEISLSTSSLNPTCKTWTNAAPQTFTISYSGVGTPSYNIEKNAGWLACTPTPGLLSSSPKAITVTYSTALKPAGTYYATITVNATGCTSKSISVKLQIGNFALTKINLAGPQNGRTISSLPTFSWTTDGGSRNAFSVEIAFAPAGPWYSTYTNLKKVIYGNSYTMTSNSWAKIQAGIKVYWRVRGRDLDVVPQNIITSNELWYFIKQ